MGGSWAKLGHCHVQNVLSKICLGFFQYCYCMIILCALPPLISQRQSFRVKYLCTLLLVWRPYLWRLQGCHYIGLDGLKLTFVHNFSMQQHFSMKFRILAVLMIEGFQVTILVNVDQILVKIWSKLAKSWSQILKLQKVT